MSNSYNNRTLGDFIPGYIPGCEEINYDIYKTEVPTYVAEKLIGLTNFEQLMVITENYFPEYFGEMDWTAISCFKGLTPKFIEMYHYLMDWKSLCCQQKFSIDFIKKNSAYMDKKILMVSHLKVLTDDLWKTLPFAGPTKKTKKKCFQNEVFEYIIDSLKISNLNEFNSLDWNNISRYRFLSEKFIDSHFDKLNIKNLCVTQRLTMYIINKYSDRLDFKCMSITQANNLDLLYILNNKNKFDIEKIKKNINVAKKGWSPCGTYVYQRRQHLGIYDDGVIVNRPMVYSI
jgi:hypothetical protein